MAKYGRLKASVFNKGLKDIKEKGFYYFLKKTFRYFHHKILVIYAVPITNSLNKKPKDYFYFNGKKYEYLIHPYNLSWINERTAEIPIVLDFLNQTNKKNILELGAVLQHYLKVQWDVVDKFETGEKVINKDILEFKPRKKFDLIITISTLEHIGFDDEDKPEKILEAIESLKKCLNKKGNIIATVPLGYNKFMDNHIFNKTLGFSRYYFMKRINRKNKWKEACIEEVKNIQYNHPYNNANAIAIGIFEK